MTLAERNQAALAKVHPELARRVRGAIGALEILRISILVVCGERTFVAQADLYQLGRNKKSTIPCRCDHGKMAIGECVAHPFGATVTNARPGSSMHQYALAVDLQPVISAGGHQVLDNDTRDNNWQQLLRVGEAFKLSEGAKWRTFPDNPHFYPVELPANPPLEFRDAYKAGGLPAVWAIADKLMGVQSDGTATNTGAA